MYSVACLAADFLQYPLRSDFERVSLLSLSYGVRVANISPSLARSCSHARHTRTSVRLRKNSFTVYTVYLDPLILLHKFRGQG